jgi:SAM-dependent methyltransferase
MICQALWERGMLCAGRRGCGFGVGQEPLPALFASLGCEVLATDVPRESIERAAFLEALNARKILPPAEFLARVGYRYVDMTNLPQNLGLFDFLWSNCALECLGGLSQGIEFVGRACRYLRPGGVAVHATEFNVSSNEETLDRGPVVLFRRRDIEQMQRRASEAGCRMAEPDFDAGSAPLELYVDRPPYGTPHLKLAFDRFVATSFLLIIEKPA